MDELEALRTKLAALENTPVAHDETPAAVLIPFVKGTDGWDLIFTRRRLDLRTHKGQISFPGGKIDPGEKSDEAALREAHEELGIDPEGVELIGRMRSFPTVVSGFMVEPWVGIVPTTQLRPNPNEIQEVIIAGIDLLRSVRREQRFLNAGYMSVTYAYDVRPDAIIWGLTAFIVSDLLHLLYGS